MIEKKKKKLLLSIGHYHLLCLLVTFIVKVNVQTMKAFCPVKEVSRILPVSPALGVVHN